MTCTCEPSTPGEHTPYAQWIGEAFGICVYENVADAIGFAAIAIHVIAWVFLFLPQFRLNYVLRSAANLSLMYITFWMLAEICFLITTILQKWAPLWLALHIWRTLMTALLLVQACYYKFGRSNDFAAAIEAPEARTGNNGYFEQHDLEYEYEPASMGWPTRPGQSSNSNSRNKSSVYGVKPAPWGQALLAGGGGGTPPHPAGDLSSSPARSRLPSSHAHLSSVAPPRTVSPHTVQSPSRAARGATAGVGADASTSFSSHAYSDPSVLPASSVGSITSSSTLPSIDNERRRAAYANQSFGAKRGSTSSAGTSPNLASSTPFQPSPTSAFTPIIVPREVQPAPNSPLLESAFEKSDASSDASSGGGGGGYGASGVGSRGPLMMMLYVCLVGLIVVYGLSGPTPTPNAPSSAPTASGARTLLSFERDAIIDPGVMMDIRIDTLLVGASTGSAAMNSTSGDICNLPYTPSDVTQVVIKIFNWLGCACGVLSFFPQYMYNDSYMKSVDGLSFLMFGVMSIGNLALILGMSIPNHNDWLNNRYTNHESVFHSYYVDQVILPMLILHGINFLQIWVFVAQRARFKKPHATRIRL